MSKRSTTDVVSQIQAKGRAGYREKYQSSSGPADYVANSKTRNRVLDKVIPKILDLLKGEIIVGNVVNLETIKEAIKQLKAG
jgi:hypothetical protein